MTLISYLNNPALKRRFVAEIEKHRKADQIEQGTYGHLNGDWRGCAVACSLRSLAIIDGEKLVTEYSRHALYESKLGIPEWLARLEDTIFEGLPKAEAVAWPSAFAKAVPVGADLAPIKWQFCTFILARNIDRVLSLSIEERIKEQVVKAIRGVLAVHEKAIATGVWDNSAARSARSAARSAYSAAYSACSAAYSAADSAAYSARWALYSAARWAYSAAYSACSAYSARWALYSAARSAYSAAYSACSAYSEPYSAAYSAAYSACSAYSEPYSAEEYNIYAEKLLALLADTRKARRG